MTALGEKLMKELDLLNALRTLAGTTDETDEFCRVFLGQRARVRELVQQYQAEQKFKEEP